MSRSLTREELAELTGIPIADDEQPEPKPDPMAPVLEALTTAIARLGRPDTSTAEALRELAASIERLADRELPRPDVKVNVQTPRRKGMRCEVTEYLPGGVIKSFTLTPIE